MPVMVGVMRLVGLAALASVLWVGPLVRAQGAAPSTYEVDRTWPRSLPDRWVLGGLSGLCIDGRDHVLLLHRQNVPEAELTGGRVAAPPVVELDASGAVVHAWGDLAALDPVHSCYFDRNNDVWIASAPSGMVQKYSHDGKTLLAQIGTQGVFDSSDGTSKGTPLNSPAPRFYTPSDVYEDAATGDVYVADGETAGNNRRVAVFDRQGRFLRQWPIEGLTAHCLSASGDGLLYVCNRARILVFDTQGAFVKHIDVPGPAGTAAGFTGGAAGAAVSLALSRDRAQRLMYVINQNNSQVAILDRTTGTQVGSFGRPGRGPGELTNAHGIAVDSKGNVYVTEFAGRRVQKFTPAR